MVNLTNLLKEWRYFIIASLFVAPVFLLIFPRCNSKKEKVIETDYSKVIVTQIADTIIYDVIIENPEPDNEWINECLKNLNKKELVDFVFDAVYEGKAEAFHYYTNEKFTIRDIEEIEKDPEFSRDKIAKVQFVEEWLLDKENFRMFKQIHSIMLGYEIKYEDGTIRGYKPTFRVYLNK